MTIIATAAPVTSDLVGMFMSVLLFGDIPVLHITCENELQPEPSCWEVEIARLLFG